MDEALARNEAAARKLVWVPAVTIGLVAGLVVTIVVALVGSPAVGLLLGLVWAVASAVGIGLSTPRAAHARVVAASGSRPLPEADEPRLHNLVEGLCIGIGLAPPRLHLIEDALPNALAVARHVDDADLVVSRGLLDRLSLVELEAVLAHELARIRRGDAIVGALAGPTLRGEPAVYPASLAAPVTRAVVARGEPVEAWTDLAAVEITRYPPALAAALGHLAAAGQEVPAGASPGLAHLWIHGARAEGAFGQALVRVYEPAPPVAQRIEVLEEL